MNRFNYVLLICSLLSLLPLNGNISITGKIIGEIPEIINYTIPINSAYYWGFNESVKPDSLGNFQIYIDSDKPSIILLMVPGVLSKKIIVEPEQHYSISIEITHNSSSYEIIGPNAKGQDQFNTFIPDRFFLQDEARKFIIDTSVALIKEKISESKCNVISKFKELLAQHEISLSFFDLMKSEIDCYYGAISTTIPLLKYYEALQTQNKEFPLDMKMFGQETFLEYPVTSERFLSTFLWYYYAENYINFCVFTNEKFDIDIHNKQYRDGTIHTYNISIAKTHFSCEMLENYYAIYLYFNCMQQNFEKELISLFDQFKKDYPDSRFIKYIEPMVNPIIDYYDNYQIIEQPFSEKIMFVNNFDSINTLKEAVTPFAGKKVYVDVWATWCGPCKDEFKYVSELRELLKSNGIEILYISIDDLSRDKQWKEMIKYYHLEGSHIRANEKLYTDLRKVFNKGGAISIPWYILINENGNISKQHARRPSEIKELEIELNEN